MRNQLQIPVVIVVINIALAQGYKTKDEYDFQDDDADYREKYGFQPSQYYGHHQQKDAPVEARGNEGEQYGTEEEPEEDYRENKYYRTGDFDSGSGIKQNYVSYNSEVDHQKKPKQSVGQNSVLRGNSIYVSYKQGEELGHVTVPQQNHGQSNNYYNNKQAVELAQEAPQPSKDYVLYKNKQAEKTGQFAANINANANKYKVTQFDQGNVGYADQTNYFNYVTQSAHKIMQGNTKIAPYKAQPQPQPQPKPQPQTSFFQNLKQKFQPLLNSNPKPNPQPYPQPNKQPLHPVYNYKTIQSKPEVQTQVPIAYQAPAPKIPATYKYPQQHQQYQQKEKPYHTDEQAKMQVVPLTQPFFQTVQQPYNYKSEDEQKPKVPGLYPAQNQYFYKQSTYPAHGESKLPQQSYSKQTYQTIQFPMRSVQYDEKNQQKIPPGGYPVPVYVVVEKPVPVYLRTGEPVRQQQQYPAAIQQQQYRKAQLVQQRFADDAEETSPENDEENDDDTSQ